MPESTRIDELFARGAGGAAEAPTTIRRIIQASRLTQIVYAAAKLGVADYVAQGAAPDVDELARRTGADRGALLRLLRALVNIGVFTLDHDDRFQLAPMGYWLRSDTPGSMRPVALLFGREPLWHAWGRLTDSVMTGQPEARPQTEDAFLDRHSNDPEYGAIFDAAMTASTTHHAPSVVAAYDFSGLTRIVDVGGGQGALLTAILETAPGAQGVLFDLPPVIAGAEARIQAAGLRYRCELVAGDCFDGVPEGGDAYILKVVIHDWDDDRSLMIMRNCRRSVRSGGRLLIVEPVMPERVDTSDRDRQVILADLHMLVATGGRERTEAEFRHLYRQAGFRLNRVIPTTSSLSIVEGIADE